MLISIQISHYSIGGCNSKISVLDRLQSIVVFEHSPFEALLLSRAQAAIGAEDDGAADDGHSVVGIFFKQSLGDRGLVSLVNYLKNKRVGRYTRDPCAFVCRRYTRE